MQKDLISRSALIKAIKENLCMGEVTKHLFIDFVEDQPTAYNVEKVVAELEEYIEYDTFDYHKEEPLINMSFEKLEDIICNGGKE